MERTRHDPVSGTECTKSAMQLGRGLAGEREHGDMGRLGDTRQALVGNSSGEDPRLAGAGTGDDR